MKYAIIHVNDRAIDNINHNKNILKSNEYINGIEYFNGNIGNGWNVLNHWGIKLDVWNPYDGRQDPPLSGEYGIWISTINVWKYMVENKVDRMLVFEDDILLQEDFEEKLYLCLADLPEDFDLLSLYYFEGHNNNDESVEIGSEYIQKSHKQYSGAQAILYSYHGAKKLLRLIQRKGMEYTPDCFIFRQSLEGLINGYSIKKENDFMLKHTYKEVKSLIDPDNIRNTDTL
jgi:GR25 family glycosyltransferase involved in LPS biosynthesis